MTDDESENGATAPVIEWIFLILISGASFWAQAVVTEERFVPALNVIATYLQIPDDVAGATLMAAGASSPELFTSFVSIFVTQSSLGMGTIVGSEIFNHLCICGGSILAARKQRLVLSRAIVLREASFYGLALVCLLIALRDRRYTDDGSEYKYIFIQWIDSYILLLGFVLYVFVCAYFNPIVQWIVRLGGSGTVEVDKSKLPSLVSSSTMIIPTLPFLRQLSLEPRTNFYAEKDLDIIELASVSSSRSEIPSNHDSTNGVPPEVAMDFKSRALCTFMVDSSKPVPSSVHGLDELTENDDGSFSCFLWQQSAFYTKARIGINAWQLRWFTFSAARIVSVPDRSYQARFSTYPFFERIEVDEAHLVMQCHSQQAKRPQVLMAPTPMILQRVVDRLNQREFLDEVVGSESSLSIKAADALAVERGPSLISFPFGASPIDQMLHICLFPIKLLMHFTIPDPRRGLGSDLTPKLRIAAFGSIMCITWLIVTSCAMVAALERLGDLMNIPSSVVGMTVSAAGTSLPNYVASVIAARQGLGNQAVSNAFGSNSFNILVGLGLPWAAYTTIFGTYSNLQDGGITTSVMILAVLLVGFVLLIFQSGFILYRWHAYLFFVLYVLYVVYAVGQVYI